MNEEKKIAQAVMDAKAMHEESYDSINGYGLREEECLIKTCAKNDVSPNLWSLLALAMYWWNDVQGWAEDILAGKDIPQK